MKILVTGGLGFVGSNLVDFLVEKGHDVSVIDNLSSESSNLHYRNSKAELSIASINKSSLMNVKYDVIFHLAAHARIQSSFDNPSEVIQGNYLSTLKMVQKAADDKSFLIFASTSSSQGGDFMSPYTYSKRACEEMIKMYRFNYGLKCSIVRFFNVYGPREPQTGEWATVIAKFAELHREGKPMTVVGNGEQRRDFTHVLDICEGLYRISKMGDDERVMQHPLDLGRGDSKSINEVVKMFEPNPIENTHYVFVPLRKNEPLLTQADIDKTEAIIGWRSTLDLSKYIAQISNSNGII